MWQVVMAAPSIENAIAELSGEFDLEVKLSIFWNSFGG
jgi:hypothetical protein